MVKVYIVQGKKIYVCWFLSEAYAMVSDQISDLALKI